MMLVVLGLFAGDALFTSTASGATITATFQDINPDQTLSYTLAGNPSTTVAGRFNWVRSADPNAGTWPHPPAPGQSFFTFCIELIQNLAIGAEYTFDVKLLANAPIPDRAPLSGPMGNAKADMIMDLWTNRILLAPAGSIDDPNHVAAMQTAVWEVVYEDIAANGLNLSTGDFTAAASSGPFVPLAQTWLDQIGTLLPPIITLVAMTSDTQQDQTFLTVIPTGEVIPAPVAAVGAVPLLAALVRRRRPT
jgi:hypothetical protein